MKTFQLKNYLIKVYCKIDCKFTFTALLTSYFHSVIAGATIAAMAVTVYFDNVQWAGWFQSQYADERNKH